MRVCLVGATHPCHNPRLVREADSLVAAGHTVRVVAPSQSSGHVARDARLLARRSWRLDTVELTARGWQGRARSLLIRGRHRLAARAVRLLGVAALREHAYSLAFPELVNLAAAETADWYIAHAHPALPVAARAAAGTKARLGFDCEDLLSEADGEPRDLVASIERTYLPQCDYVSVPSQSVADWLGRRYSMTPPVVLYNVFPLHLADCLPAPGQRDVRVPLRVHWFGQTIGPGRGVEEAVAAVGQLGGDVQLHLRGEVNGAFRSVLERAIHAAAAESHVVVHHVVDHDAVIGTMGQFDVGLALERPSHGNYSRAATNKLFAYLLAGLAVICTNTPGQQEVLQQAPGAGLIYPAGDANALAGRLRRWLTDLPGLRAAQQAAWDVARDQFCWDREQNKFFGVLGLASTERRSLS